MKTLKVKLPDFVFAEIAATAKARKVSKSEIVRERLSRGTHASVSLWDRMKDLVIDEDELPEDLSANKEHLKHYP